MLEDDETMSPGDSASLAEHALDAMADLLNRDEIPPEGEYRRGVLLGLRAIGWALLALRRPGSE